MPKVTIDVEDGREAFNLCYKLADIAADYGVKIIYAKDHEQWYIDWLKKQQEFFKRLSRQVASQTSPEKDASLAE